MLLVHFLIVPLSVSTDKSGATALLVSSVTALLVSNVGGGSSWVKFIRGRFRAGPLHVVTAAIALSTNT
jgi:hypothetical protein